MKKSMPVEKLKVYKEQMDEYSIYAIHRRNKYECCKKLIGL